MSHPPAVGAKLVTVFERNHARICLPPGHRRPARSRDRRVARGARRAVHHGSADRAVSAVSVKHLSRPDADVLAVIGSGVQAGATSMRIRHVRTISEGPRVEPEAEHRDTFVLRARGIRTERAGHGHGGRGRRGTPTSSCWPPRRGRP
jgi:hypothetical protein